MRVYFDSSAFVKRYIQERNTDVVLAWCERADELALSTIAIPELISAFCRLHREGMLNSTQYEQIKADLMQDVRDALIIETTPDVTARAINALEMYPLRGMDAIHTGAALACQAEAFVSSDNRQCQAAEGLGLNVVSV